VMPCRKRSSMELWMKALYYHQIGHQAHTTIGQ
jgi:hypothetical protein